MRHVLGYFLVIFVGMYFGLIIERRRAKASRSGKYTTQTCVECGNGRVYPAMCDDCGASWIACMYLEGWPRRQPARTRADSERRGPLGLD